MQNSKGLFKSVTISIPYYIHDSEGPAGPPDVYYTEDTTSGEWLDLWYQLVTPKNEDHEPHEVHEDHEVL